MRAELERCLTGLGRRGHGTAVAGVARGDERAHGVWRPRGELVDQRSIFEIGSLTKVLTGVLLADMVLAGEAALGDPLSRHLPEPRLRWKTREPTLLELATHRSGLPNVPRPLARRELAHALGLSGGDPWEGVTREGYERLIAAESARARPGGRVRYSSMGVGLLGDALAARAETTFDALLRERVLGPLGMNRTGVAVPAALGDAVVTGRSRRGRPRPPLRDWIPAAGGVRSTSEDMLAFLAACLRPPADPPGPALALAQRPHGRLGRGTEVGLCWLIAAGRRGHPRTVWHSGGTWGFRSFAAFSPQTGTAAVVLSSSARGVDGVGRRLVAARWPDA